MPGIYSEPVTNTPFQIYNCVLGLIILNYFSISSCIKCLRGWKVCEMMFDHVYPISLVQIDFTYLDQPHNIVELNVDMLTFEKCILVLPSAQCSSFI